MYRGWLGAGLLALFLALGAVTMELMDRAHLPTGDLLEQAAESALAGDFTQGVNLGMEAKNRWKRQWQATATVADHAPMDEIDGLFAQLAVYHRAAQPGDFAACCTRLSMLVAAMSEAHSLTWWNLL